MTDHDTAFAGRAGDIDLTDGLTPSERVPDREGIGTMVSDETDEHQAVGPRDRGQVATMAATTFALTVGVVFGVRWVRKRRRAMTVVIIDEPEAARWRRMVRRGRSIPAAA